MNKTLSKRPSPKEIYQWMIQILGTFLFVFFLMATIILFTTGMRGSFWFLPYFVLPSCLICITLGADYWIAGNPLRRWSYFVSAILCAVLLVPSSLAAMLDYGTSTTLRLYTTILLPIFPILYGLSMVRSRNTKNPPTPSDEMHPRSEKSNSALKNVKRIVCLLSICCVLLENGYRVLSILYTLTLCKPDSLVFGMFVPLPLFVLSVILLVRFFRAGFVPRRDLSNPDVPLKGWKRTVAGVLTIAVAMFALTSAALFCLRDAFVFGSPVRSYTRQELSELFFQEKDLLSSVQQSVMTNDTVFQSRIIEWYGDIDRYIPQVQAYFQKDEWENIVCVYQTFQPYALSPDLDIHQHYFAFRMSFGKQKLDSGSKAISLYWFSDGEDFKYHRKHSMADSLAYTQMGDGWYIVEENFR